MKIFLILGFLVKLSLFGVMAIQSDVNLQHKDGSGFQANMKGDEWFHWIQTKDGYVAKYNPQNKNYEYMVLDANNSLVSSNYKVQTDIAPLPQGQVGVYKISAPTQLNLPSNIQKITQTKLKSMWKKARDKALKIQTRDK